MRPEPQHAATLPRWLAPGGVAASVAGLAVSVYLTIEHYTASATLACPDTGVVNCRRVTASAQSELFGIPIVWPGILFFAVMLVANLPAAWRSNRAAVTRGRVAVATAGTVFVLYLIQVELFALGAICLWCTAVHALTIGLFGLVAFGTALTVPDR
jgi:uncharacterized membrane protein